MAYTPQPTIIPIYNINESPFETPEEFKRQIQLNFEDLYAMLAGGLSTVAPAASEDAMAWAFFMDGEG